MNTSDPTIPFNKAMEMLIGVGEIISGNKESSREQVIKLIRLKYSMNIDDIFSKVLTQNNISILSTTVLNYTPLSNLKPKPHDTTFPQNTLDIGRAIYFMQNQEITPSDACNYVLGITRDRLDGILIYQIDHAPAKGIQVLESDTIDGASINLVTNRRYFHYLRGLSNAIRHLKSKNGRNKGLGTFRQQVISPIINALTNRVHHDPNFTPDAFKWSDILDDTEIDNRVGLPLKGALLMLPKQGIIENLYALIQAINASGIVLGIDASILEDAIGKYLKKSI